MAAGAGDVGQFQVAARVRPAEAGKTGRETAQKPVWPGRLGWVIAGCNWPVSGQSAA